MTQPINDDWISCDGGPATDFTCDYSSSRYYDPAPLPTEPFQRTVTYSVTDGTTTSTGVWTVTVVPPPTMQITGDPTVTEGGDAVLQLSCRRIRYRFADGARRTPQRRYGRRDGDSQSTS